MGWDRFGNEGSFLQDSPEAKEALDALANYQSVLDDAVHDPETMAAAAQGVDRSSQYVWARLADGGPLDRYGWDDEGLPPLDKLKAGVLKKRRPQSLNKAINNDHKLIAALAYALLGKGGIGPYGGGVSMDLLAKDIEVWAKSRGVRGLGESTVKEKLRAALRAVDVPQAKAQ